MWLKFREMVFPIAALGILIFFAFGQLFDSFYEQDEWKGIGIYLTTDSNSYCVNTDQPLQTLLGQGRQLSALITCFSYNHFPFNTAPMVFYRLGLHFINSLLVFLILRKVLKREVFAILGSSFFAVNAVAQGTVTWFAAHGTIPATTMILLAFLALLKSVRYKRSLGLQGDYEDENKRGFGKKWLVVSIFALYISFLFKQIDLFMFILFPLWALMYSGSSKKNASFFNAFSKKYYLLLVGFFLFIGYWLVHFKSISGTEALFLTGSSANFYITLIVRSILYPLTSFSLVFVPPETFLTFARFITNIYYPLVPAQQFILIAQTIVLDLLAVILSFLIFVVILFLQKRVDVDSRKYIWFFVIFILLSFLPYVMISKSYAYLESRYYYLAAVGAAFILAWIISAVWDLSRKVGLVLILFAFLFISYHAIEVHKYVEKQKEVSLERKNFLSQLTSIQPNLDSNKNVFLITGSDDFYLSGNKAPFQSGIGHTLAVWYYHTGKVPKEVAKEGKLFEIGSQGYFEYDAYGFGYFYDLDLFKKSVVKNELPASSINAYYYNAEKKELIDISEELVEDLKKDDKTIF